MLYLKMSKIAIFTLIVHIFSMPIKNLHFSKKMHYFQRMNRDLAAQNRLANMRDSFLHHHLQNSSKIPKIEKQIAKHLFDSKADMQVLTAYLNLEVVNRKSQKSATRRSRNRLRRFRNFHQ